MALILTTAEARVACGFTSSITDLHRALFEIMLPMIDGAVEQVLHYNPTYATVSEWYPLNSRGASPGIGVWQTNGQRAYLESSQLGEVLQLRRLPVRSISEIRVDTNGGFGQKAGTFGDATIWAAGTQYFQELLSQGYNATGHVFSETGWPSEPGTIKVTYRGGYSDAELAGRATQGPQTGDTALNASQIKKAALLTLVKLFKTAVAHAKQNLAGVVAGPLASESLGSYSYSTHSAIVSALVGMKASVPAEALDDLGPFINYGYVLGA